MLLGIVHICVIVLLDLQYLQQDFKENEIKKSSLINDGGNQILISDD